MQHHAPGKLHAGIEKELADGLAGPARILLRHEGVLVADDRVFDLAQPVLKAFAARAIDMAASEHDMRAPLSAPVDAEPKSDEGSIVIKAVLRTQGVRMPFT